ncbi:MAG: winged helix-turn-helix transcriptional regulator [Methanosarcinaceae archaeon]|nr:winged helix-turn-helix transcriptional regulator [Methanosarcinaceae archaeon]
MNSKYIFYVFIYIIAIALLISTAQAANTATIHGAVYEWYTFQPIENAVIEVNSTPPQSIVAKYGLYSFNLAPGNYLITAKYYTNNTLMSFAEELITITDDGDYVLDLLLFPSYDEEILNKTELSEITDDFEEDIKTIEDNTNSSLFYLIAVIMLFVVVRFSIYAYKKRSSENEELMPIIDVDAPEEIEHTAEIKTTVSLPSDLQEIIDIIKANDGRITQKDLRSKLKYSEAKVSLMVSDLEQRGVIKKFKQGRGNIILIRDNN